MGRLMFPSVNGSENYTGDKRTSKVRFKNYTNRNAVKYAIEDITRSRPNEKYFASLVGYGSRGVCYGATPQEMIQCFEFVQNAYNIESRGGRRLFHEVFWLSEEDMQALNYDYSRLWFFAWQCSDWYFTNGFQVVFAIHTDGQKYHIHFVINSINYLTGLKFHASTQGWMDTRNEMFNNILEYHKSLPQLPLQPIRFTNRPAYKPNLYEGEIKNEFIQ